MTKLAGMRIKTILAISLLLAALSPLVQFYTDSAVEYLVLAGFTIFLFTTSIRNIKVKWIY